MLNPHIDEWLRRKGYEYYCFISWPRINDKDMQRCAQALEISIKEALTPWVNDPQVFRDASGLQVGDDWRKKIERSLCRSVAMVAICCEMYYSRHHLWCGREWAAMSKLGQRRLIGETHGAIIPVMYRVDKDTDGRFRLPRAVSPTQCIDISQMALRRRFLDSDEFRAVTNRIVERIAGIAAKLAERGVAPDCSKFVIPRKSAFADYEERRKAYPLRRVP